MPLLVWRSKPVASLLEKQGNHNYGRGPDFLWKPGFGLSQGVEEPEDNKDNDPR